MLQILYIKHACTNSFMRYSDQFRNITKLSALRREYFEGRLFCKYQTNIFMGILVEIRKCVKYIQIFDSFKSKFRLCFKNILKGDGFVNI